MASAKSTIVLPTIQSSKFVDDEIEVLTALDQRSACKLMRLPVIPDQRGKLCFLERDKPVPFDIARVYYLFDVPSAATRGGHAHKDLRQLLISISGSFDVKLDNGREQRTVQLNRPDIGLLITTKIWREIDNFSSAGICLVLASLPYEEADYYRDYDAFIESFRD